MDLLRQDISFAFRVLRRNPGFTAVAVLTLALGIGANTAIFSVVHALLWKPLPYSQPHQLVAVVLTNTEPRTPDDYHLWTVPRMRALSSFNRSFQSIAAYREQGMILGRPEEAENVQVEQVSAGYFPTLGVPIAVGRNFSLQEGETPAASMVAILSHALWQRRFDSDPAAIGKIVHLDGNPYNVVGVAPAGFAGQTGVAQLWVPVASRGQVAGEVWLGPRVWWLRVVARLKDGVTLEGAQAEMPLLAESVVRESPPVEGRAPSGTGREGLKVIPFRETKVNPEVNRSFLLLLAAAGFVLLIACANTASLFLGRGVARQKELAVRAALGATRGQLARALLAESVVVALLAGAAAFLMAVWAVDVLASLKPLNTISFSPQYARTFGPFSARPTGFAHTFDYFAVGPDYLVLTFNFVLAALAGCLAGLAALRSATHAQIVEVMRRSAGGFAGGPQGGRLRSSLVMAQVALSVMLLTGAGLSLRSMAALFSEPLGFDPEGIMSMQVVPREASRGFERPLLERIQQVPGVESASISNNVPLNSGSTAQLRIAGLPADAQPKDFADINIVSPSFFDTFRIRVLRGRGFTERDQPGSRRVVVVNRALAETFWPGQEAIGQRLLSPFRVGYPGGEDEAEVVGVVDDVKYSDLEVPRRPAIYYCAWQPVLRVSRVAVRTRRLDAGAVLNAVRREVSSIDARGLVFNVQPMVGRVAEASARSRTIASMLGVFATVALALTAVGIYGVMAFMVSARTREFGIRLALGAQPVSLMGLVLRQMLARAGVGLGVGLALSAATTRFVQSFWYGVDALDLTAFILAAVVLLGAAVTACWIPARRAMRTDPMVALRYE